MVTKTGLTIIQDGKRVNVYTPQEIKNHRAKNQFICSLKKLLKINYIKL